jgi:hypothetical protein
MIRRDDGRDWLLISQVDHAHLAGEIAALWGNESVPALPLPEWLVPAVRDHDEAWREWEHSPSIDPDNGKPREFLEMTMPEATQIWSRSISACDRRPMSRLWVSRHFQYLARLALDSRKDVREDVAALESFLAEQAEVERVDRAAYGSRPELGGRYDEVAEQGFRFVQMFDRMSLWLCCATRSKPQDFSVPGFGAVRFTPQPDGSTFVAEPFPLSVDELSLSVPARRIPAKIYESDANYRKALAAAPVEMLRWVIARKTLNV